MQGLKIKNIFLAVTFFVLLVSYNNCAPSFQSSSELKLEITSIGGDGGSPVGPIDPETPVIVKPTNPETRVSRMRCEPQQIQSYKKNSDFFININLLTSEQYKNTIKDSLGINVNPDFKERSVSDGFNNMADSSSVDISDLNKQLSMAEQISSEILSKQDLRNKFLNCPNNSNDEACVKLIIKRLGSLLFRRPIQDAEVNRVYKYANQGHNSNRNQKIEAAIQMIVLSPSFAYQIIMPNNENVKDLTDHELATRLSYFLWNSSPDQTLIDLANSNQLKANLSAQVDRMLVSGKSAILAKDLALYGFHLNGINSNVNDNLLNQNQNNLNSAKLSETIHFMNKIIKDKLDVTTLVNSDFSFINDKLGNVYGFDKGGSKLELMDGLQSTLRSQGLLTQASILSYVSGENHTHIISRGSWMLENVLCDSPPGVPSNVNIDGATDELGPNANPLEIVKAHSDQASSCYACHKVMDPMGIAFEEFDNFGKWRAKYKTGHDINTSSELEDGTKISDVKDMAKYIYDTRREDLNYCISEKLTRYALGSQDSSRYKDCMSLSSSVNGEGEKLSFTDIIKKIVVNPLFTKYSDQLE